MTSLAATLDRSRRERESWRYTDLAKLLAARTANMPAHVNGNLAPTADGQARLVFVNGIFQAAQSHFASVPSCILMGEAATGYRLMLGDKTCLAALPIELLFLTDAQAPAEIAIKLSVELGANARLSLLERHAPSASVTVVDMAIALQDRAKLVHGKIVEGGAHLATTRATIAAGALYDTFALLRGGSPVRNEIDAHLNGPEAQAIAQGVMLLGATDHADTTIRIHHHAAQCASRQVYRSVLGGKARGVFQGKIFVAPGAQKTDGYQLSRALLLSDQAEIDVKPELEIHADDVKCSHGSAIGDLDENALFYLRARGLNAMAARALLIDAFVGELFDALPEGWRDTFRTVAAGWQA